MTEQLHKDDLEQALQCFSRYSLAFFGANPTECHRMLSEAWIKTHAVMTNLGEGEAIISDYRSYQDIFLGEATILFILGQKIGVWGNPDDSSPFHYQFNSWQPIKRAFDALDFLAHSLEPLVPLSLQYQRLTTDSDRQRTKLRSRISSVVKWQKDKSNFGVAHEEIRRLVNDLESLFPGVVTAGSEIQTEGFPAVVTETTYGDQPTGSRFTIRETQYVKKLDDESHGAANQPIEPSRPGVRSKTETGQLLDRFHSNLQRIRDLREPRSAVSDNVGECKDHLTGTLRITMHGNKYPIRAEVGWQGAFDKEYQERHLCTQNEKSSHPSWSLKYASAEVDQSCLYSDCKVDSEASKFYEGIFPGTRTISGFTADFNEWAIKTRPELDEREFSSYAGKMPDHPQGQLVQWLSELQQRQALPENVESEETLAYMRQLLGLDVVSAHSGDEYRLDDQIKDFLSVLNRVDVFLEYKEETSPSTKFLFDPKKMMFQIILAYELKLRLDQRLDRSFANMGDQSIAAMEISNRWIEGIQLEKVSTEWNDDGFDIKMLVHMRQLEGLLRFAEVIQWPHLDELCSFIQTQSETQCQTQLLGGGGTQRLLNWMYGILLPGAGYVFTIMTALVAATPEITFLGEPTDTACGLILHDRSYWRSKHVLGRLFGGLKGVESSNGWIGPCPLPLGNGETIKPGWWRVQEKQVPFIWANYSPMVRDVGYSGLVPRIDQAQDEATHDNAEMPGDESNMVGAVPPRNSATNAIFDSLTFIRTTQESGWEPVRRAVLSFRIDNAPLTVLHELEHKPTFIAAPRCIDGPHLVDLKDLHKLERVVDVRDIGSLVNNDLGDKRTLVIDATGQGECELLARAWCSQRGRHAVITKVDGETCFTCAVRAAGDQGLGVGCLIWTC